MKRITRRDKRRFYHLKAEETEAVAAVGDQKTLYRIVKDLSGVYGAGSEGVIMDSNGNKIVKEEEKGPKMA